MKYKVLTNIRTTECSYVAGELIDLTTDEAAELLRVNAVEPYHAPFSAELKPVTSTLSKGTKLGDTFHNMIEAAGELRGRILELDAEMATLNAQRQELLDATVSKADYLAYIKTDVARRGASYGADIAAKLKRGANTKYSYLSRLDKSDSDLLDLPYLTGDRANFPVITYEAVFFLFGALIVQRIEEVLHKMDWTENTIPAADCQALIAKIDTATLELSNERECLPSLLLQSGLLG